MVNEAALRAARMGRGVVAQEDLMESVETVFAGKEKKDRVLSPKERQMVAYHEVGHRCSFSNGTDCVYSAGDAGYI